MSSFPHNNAGKIAFRLSPPFPWSELVVFISFLEKSFPSSSSFPGKEGFLAAAEPLLVSPPIKRLLV